LVSFFPSIIQYKSSHTLDAIVGVGGCCCSVILFLFCVCYVCCLASLFEKQKKYLSVTIGARFSVECWTNPARFCQEEISLSNDWSTVFCRMLDESCSFLSGSSTLRLVQEFRTSRNGQCSMPFSVVLPVLFGLTVVL